MRDHVEILRTQVNDLHKNVSVAPVSVCVCVRPCVFEIGLFIILAGLRVRSPVQPAAQRLMPQSSVCA
jgi:hypothetical protein